MLKEIRINMSDLHDHYLMGRKLWATPGSGRPYWASSPSFRDDYVAATVWDFMDKLGYDLFDDEPDYDEHDEEVTLVVDLK